jgi:hypothetical protein
MAVLVDRVCSASESDRGANGFPMTEQPSLFPFEKVATATSHAPAVRCWLVAERDGRDAELRRALSERRHILIDAGSGHVAIGENDVILMVERAKNEIACLAPVWMSTRLPLGLREDGLGFYARLLGERSVSLLHPSRRQISCIVLDFRQGPRRKLNAASPNRLIELVISELFSREVDPATRTQIAADWLDRIDDRVPKSLTGVIRFELAKIVTELSAGISEHLLAQAAALFRHAVRDLKTSSLLSCADSAERRLREVEEVMFHRQQGCLAFIEPPAESDPDWHVPHLGFGVHRLLCTALPALPLRVANEDDNERDSFERKHLFSMSADHALLGEILPKDLTALRASVSFGWRHGGLRPGREVLRLRRGREMRVSALLDGEFHQLIGMPSNGDGREVTVFVDSNGIDVLPEHKRGWVGKPVDFRATGGEAGIHDVRFTFLTHERVVSKLQRKVEVVDF